MQQLLEEDLVDVIIGSILVDNNGIIFRNVRSCVSGLRHFAPELTSALSSFEFAPTR
jgi:hypothetical protein